MARELAKTSNRFTLGEFYYIFFKHKRKIAAFALGGVLAAVITWLLWPVTYEAEAKLFVRYVLESKAPGPVNSESHVKSPDERGETILNSEMEILTSLDLAEQVVAAVGAEKILGGGSNRHAAAAMIRNNLKLEVPNRSSVIVVSFRHPDPTVVQPVLDQLLKKYLEKHNEVHRTLGLDDDFLTLETAQLRSRLSQTEEELRAAKNRVGILSLTESERGFTEQISKIRQEIFNTEAELAERKAMLQQLGVSSPDPASSEANEEQEADIVRYQNLRKVLDDLYLREQEAALKLTPENPGLKKIRSEILAAQQAKKEFETRNPNIASLAAPVGLGEREGRETPVFSAANESARIAALESKVNILNEQLKKVQGEASSVSEVEPLMTELQRKKEIQEAHYRYFSENLEQARIDEALRAGTVPNISLVQKPSAPGKFVGKLYPIAGALLLSGLLIGICMAWVIESYVDQSIKRPIDVETRLGLPLFFSIPAFNGNGHGRLRALRSSHAESADAHANKHPSTEIVPWAINHPLRSSLEDLRDRLLFYFEAKKLTRKPKLVAVTSCREGAGVSTVAAGLAATLSEIGDGNVLLIDMHLDQNLPQLFRKGDLSCGLDTVLDGDMRGNAMVQDNLYVACNGAGDDKLARILPKGFTELVPRLKASDYDFIIFDMPPVTQNSATPQLARYMDIALLVVEAEKNSPDAIKRASALIKETKSRIGIVLNKTREYVPARLQHQA